MTQLMARFTHMLDSRKKVPMTGRVYLRSIVPIGVMFSLSLICGNLAYLYLSVSFIQMLKVRLYPKSLKGCTDRIQATMPVVTLLVSWVMRVAPPSLKTLGNVSLIVLGVIIASLGEIKFVLIGFLFQCGGILFEAIRLVMVQQLLSGAEFKMDPLVSLYYFAPICAIINAIIALGVEVPKMTLLQLQDVGFSVLLLNAVVAFLLNVSVVFLVSLIARYNSRCLSSSTDHTFLTDRQDLVASNDPFRRSQRHPSRSGLYATLPRSGVRTTSFWLYRCALRPYLLPPRRRQAQRVRWTWPAWME